MNTPRQFAAGWLLLLLGACSHLQHAPDTASPALAASRPVTAGAYASSLRALRSDTTSLPYAVLARFLPAHVAGFVREGKPQGESVQLGGISYSTCEQHYRKGHRRLKVQLVDYNGAVALYAGATALMNEQIWQESEEQLMRGCNLGMAGVCGYETVQKLERRAAVALGVGGRFFVSVESTEQHDTRLVKAVARTLNLKGLAAL